MYLGQNHFPTFPGTLQDKISNFSGIFFGFIHSSSVKMWKKIVEAFNITSNLFLIAFAYVLVYWLFFAWVLFACLF